MGDRIHIRRTIRKHRSDGSSSFNRRNKISCQDSISIPHVRKVSRSQRHFSLQIKPQHPSIKETDSKNPVHVAIPSQPTDTYPTERKLTDTNGHSHLVNVPDVYKETQADDIEEVDRQRPFTQQLNYHLFNNELPRQNTSSKTDYTASHFSNTNHTKSIPAKERTFETISCIHHPNVRTNINNQFHSSISHMKDQHALPAHRRNPKNEYKLKPKKNRICRAGYCSQCRPLQIFFSSFAALLLLSAIVAVLLAFIKPANASSSTTISTSDTVTTTSTSTTTTTARPIIAITRAGDPIIGLYNTSAGQSTGAANGSYSNAAETPDKAIDGLLTTKYLNFGHNGSHVANLSNPGVGTGFYVTPAISNASVAIALRFATGNDDPNRDPLTVTLEGTNATGVAALNLGSSWTLIYNGSTGIHRTTAPTRSTYVPQQNFSNTIAYRSYRLLVTSQRNYSDAVQYAESEILGYA